MADKEINKNKKTDTPIYIGWVAKAPPEIVHFIRRNMLWIIAGAILLGAVLALAQKKFGTGSFEYGQLTEVKGIYFDKPVTCIKVIAGKDLWGNLSYITIPLVGYGKHGAEGVIADIEKGKNITFNQKEITLRGTLLYNDGKTILQIDGNDHPVVNISGSANTGFGQQKKDLGIVKIKGEIIDPKCYFGVMKPGEGKPHRDCAIRCILGGIPPMLAVKNEKGEANYYILTGSHGERMNQTVQDFVAEPVEIKAHLIQYDDWIVAEVESKDDIKRYSFLRYKFGDVVQSCSSGCKKKTAIARIIPRTSGITNSYISASAFLSYIEFGARKFLTH